MKSKSKRKSDYSLDFRKAIVSMALLELSSVFEKMTPDQVMDVYVQDKDTIADICKVLPQACYEMNIIEEESVNRLKIKKLKSYQD